jgi:hypothetical protein
MAMTTLELSSLQCRPRFATARSPHRLTAGGAVGEAAKQIGQSLMPWQQLVADVGLELLDDGRPAFREVILTVPRQNGKTILELAVMAQRALGWGGPQRILYSAQTGADARKKLVEDWYPILEHRKDRLGIRRILTGNGFEAVEFRNLSRIVLLASSQDSGHGKTVDLAMHDEIFADADDRREQATIPAMATKPAAQTWLASTMGTDDSVFLNRKVELGRESVVAGTTTGVAYFEWSSDPVADIDDPATWWSCMPALGHTITEDVVRHARRSMPEGEFRRAFLNQRTTSDERVIPVAMWLAVQDASVKPEPLVFGFDVNPERSAAAIGVSDRDAVELVEYRRGIGWAVDRLVELTEKHGGHVALDPVGPAGPFLYDLLARNVRVAEVAGRDLVRSCGSFYDDVADRRFRVRPHADLDSAVAGASRRLVGDAWAWARRSSDVDISPLVAVTLARWVALAIPDPGPWQPMAA